MPHDLVVCDPLYLDVGGSDGPLVSHVVASMRVGHQNLTASNPTATISYDEPIEYITVYNNNPAPVYIRFGSPELPNQRNFDVVVSPMYIMTLHVNAKQFGFRLGDEPTVTSLLTGTTVIEGMIHEAPPALGGVPILGASLATADLSSGFQNYSGASLVGPFNLTLWGGVTVFVLPATASGQGVIDVQTSSDGNSWHSFGVWGVFPGVPLALNLPRIGNQFRFVLNSTAIPGEPAISGVYAVRASLSEIQTIDFNVSSNNYVKNYSFAGLGSNTFYYVTAGLPAIILRMNVSSGVRQEMVWYTGPTASGPWSLAAFREQSVAGFYNSIYRSLGNLDNFLRVDILDIGNNAGSGTLALSVPGGPDLTAYLQNIYAALGDPGQPVNTNQSIYHVLLNANTNIAGGNAVLSSMNSFLSTINGRLTGTTSVAASGINATSGAWANTGVDMAVNGRIVAARADLHHYSGGIVTNPIQSIIGYGLGAPVAAYYQCMQSPGLNANMSVGEWHVYGSVRDGGVSYGSNNRIWVRQDGFVGGATIWYTVVYVA